MRIVSLLVTVMFVTVFSAQAGSSCCPAGKAAGAEKVSCVTADGKCGCDAGCACKGADGKCTCGDKCTCKSAKECKVDGKACCGDAAKCTAAKNKGDKSCSKKDACPVKK